MTDTTEPSTEHSTEPTTQPTPSPADGSVVVGVDGSEPARGAVRWAATSAAQTGLPLAAYRAVSMPVVHARSAALGPPIAVRADEHALEQARAELDEALEEARREHPDLEVHGGVARTAAAALLLEASERADLLVIGTHGYGPVASLFLGGTADEVVTHARGPVVLVPSVDPEQAGDPAQAGEPADSGEPAQAGQAQAGGLRRERTVAVATDGSPSAEAAVASAARHAARVRAPLEVCLAVEPMVTTPLTPVAPVETGEEVMAGAREVVDEIVARVTSEHEGLEVSGHVLHGHASLLIQALTERCALTVVGSRGLGVFTGLLLGSVSRKAAQLARGPLAVIR